MNHQTHIAIEYGTEGRIDPPLDATLDNAWNSALTALEQLGFLNVTCVLRHDRLPTGLCVLRSGAALSHVVDLVTRELPSRVRPGGFTISLGAAHAAHTAGWILAPAGRCALIRPECKIEAKRLAIQSYDQFMRILDARPNLEVEPKQLSEREKECLSLLAQGLRTQRIAERIAISPATVEFHFKNARKKLGALTREQALAISVQNGWVRVRVSGT
ncbi:MAG: helix-turn-helix transcriptional regulator [Hyphomicrobiales bacterium]|jgi:DNA-binding CsgD family transcriptional regulator